MNFRLKTAATGLLAVSLVVSFASAVAQTAPAKKHPVAKKAKTPPGPTVEEQIQSLRQEFQGQIDGLKSNLADKDTQLKQAQQAAADAQAAAAKAQAAADAQQAAVTENNTAVTTLKSTVDDLKGNQVSIVSTMSDETTAIKKAMANPDVINFKGVTISPSGSFLAAETVWRQGATGGDINTPFTGVPLNNSDAAQLSEFFGSGRQSRIAIKAIGKLPSVTLSGYYEMDWLSAGVTSNNTRATATRCGNANCGAMHCLAADGTFQAELGGHLPRRPRRDLPEAPKFCRLLSTHNTRPALYGVANTASACQRLSTRSSLWASRSRMPRH